MASIEHTVQACSARLWAAERERRPTGSLLDGHPALDAATAYAIQRATFHRRESALAGFKLGGTVRPAPGEDRRSFGRLAVAQRLPGGGQPVEASRFLKPCVEPEIALRLARELRGAGHDARSVASHLDAVLPALEIADTRYAEYPAALLDNIADNSSGGAFVLGEPLAWSRAGDLREVEVVFREDGTVRGHGRGSDVLGDPLLALAWLAAALEAQGEALPAGAVVLTGGLVAAGAGAPGKRFAASFSGLGDVALEWGEGAA